MTSERFKDEVDRLDSGLPDHPDASAYKRDGRAARRRRQGIVALGAGALVAAVVTPAVMWSGGTATTGPIGDVAADTSVAEPSDPPASLVPVDAAYGAGVDAAVAETFPEATYTETIFGDHYARERGALRPVASTPPNWEDVFTWNQGYAIDGLQYFYAYSYWDSIPAESMQWCSAGSFEIEKDCTITESNGYTIVVHDGVHLQGEPDGDWMRSVQVVAPTSERGRTQVSDVSAQVEGMTWAEAATVLPSVAELTAVATDARLRLPEPVEMPSRS